MYQTSPYSNLSPNVWGSLPMQTFPGFAYQGAAGQSVNPYTSGIGQTQGQLGQVSPFQSIISGAQPGYGTPPSYLSPETFVGSLLRGAPSQQGAFGTTETIFISELSRTARGLQEISDQIEGRDPETQRRGVLAVTAHLFYVFGLLTSKGVFIPGDLPGKTRIETGGPANATREFGKQLERFVEKIASGRNPVEELSQVVERGKICFSEITRAIETGETHPTQESRKKAA
jgi:hypothetical protein